MGCYDFFKEADFSGRLESDSKGFFRVGIVAEEFTVSSWSFGE